MNELELLQALRLKGRVRDADLAAPLSVEPGSIGPAIAELAGQGLVTAGQVLKLTPDGRERLAELLAAERSTVDRAAVAGIYAEFRSINADFKALIADWQLRDGQANDHSDPHYDQMVLARLDAVHERVMPMITAVAAHVPRLGAYRDRLALALRRVQSGDLPWLTRPIIDSYHTVWFELHEELIGAAGLTRDDEARAGHAD